MRLCQSLLLVVCAILFQCCPSVSSLDSSRVSMSVQSSAWDEPKFTISPDKPQCYKNNEIILVEVTSYLAGTNTVNTKLNNVPYYLRWSDLPQVDVGNAYLVNADNPAQNSKALGHITTTVKNGVATFRFWVVGGDETRLYQLMASDMADPRLCHPVYSCAFKICKPDSGGFGDPQFIGLQGQSYQVHGRPDTLFNLVSWPSRGLAVVSEFVYLAHGSCDYNNTQCWSHPGTYFGKMGLLINNSTRVLVNSGAHQRGLQVYINDKHMKQSDEAIVIGSSSVHVVDYDRVEIRTPDFFIALVNSDMFLNMEVSLLDKKLLESGRQKSYFGRAESDLTGLLGQTWLLKDYTSSTGVVRPYKGTTDDYIVDTPYEFMH